MIKIALYGKSGSGKSTVASMVKRYFVNKNMTIGVVKLAEPLYYLQNEVYRVAGKPIGYYEQDQKMLEIICTWLRELNPISMISNFDENMKNATADVILNDDVRDVECDVPHLKNEGFYFIKITCEEELRVRRLKERSDLSTVVNSKTTEKIDEILQDYVIDTTISDITLVEKEVVTCLDRLLMKRE